MRVILILCEDSKKKAKNSSKWHKSLFYDKTIYNKLS